MGGGVGREEGNCWVGGLGGRRVTVGGGGRKGVSGCDLHIAQCIFKLMYGSKYRYNDYMVKAAL